MQFCDLKLLQTKVILKRNSVFCFMHVLYLKAKCMCETKSFPISEIDQSNHEIS